MKKHLRLSTILLLTLAVLLTGCAAALGLEAEKEHQEPISKEDWPTPAPTPEPGLPTPFPKITLAPTATPAPLPPPTTVAAAPTAAPAAGPQNLVNAITSQLGSLGGLSPVAVGFVTRDNTTIRQGPGSSYAAVDTVGSAELLAVLGQNTDGSWLYAITISNLRGWLPGDALRLTGTPEKAPVLPPNPLEAILAGAIAGGTAGPVESGNSPAGPPPNTLSANNLKPVARATVNNDSLNMRQRPGAAYKLLAALSRNDQVSVLALNRDQQWALVETADQKLGWVSVDFLDVDGDLSAAPLVKTLPLANNHPADQVAAMVAITGRPVAAVAAGGSPAPAAAATGSGSIAPANTLAAVTTGRVIQKTDLRRGPGEEFGAVATVTVDEPVSVRAVDPGRTWAVVEAPNSRIGWAPLNSLSIEGSLDSAPAVVTAWVNSNALQVRGGPGIYYQPTGTLALNNLVSVLGLNADRDWALVETTAGGQGWIPLKFLTLGGTLAQMPEIPNPPVAAIDPASQVKPGPLTGKMVFQQASGGDIMVINADGTGLRRLTSGIDPVLSPDGQTVAFTRWQGESGSLWLIGVDGSNERQVLGFTKQAKGPDWSPDGSKIVINFQHGGRLDEKSVCQNIARAGRPPRNASRVRFNIDESDGEPQLCWQMPPDPMWQLRVVNLADGSFEDVDGGPYAFRPAWDPTQPWRIISDGGQGLLQVDLGNRDNRLKLTDRPEDSSPVFSPDGRYLAVTAGHPAGGQGHDIYRMNADGSGRVRLTQTPLWETSLPQSSRVWNNVAPAWSPDGSQLAFLTDRTGRWEIWVMNIDGSNQRPLFPAEVNDRLNIRYDFVDERVMSWR